MTLDAACFEDWPDIGAEIDPPRSRFRQNFDLLGCQLALRRPRDQQDAANQESLEGQRAVRHRLGTALKRLGGSKHHLKQIRPESASLNSPLPFSLRPKSVAADVRRRESWAKLTGPSASSPRRLLCHWPCVKLPWPKQHSRIQSLMLKAGIV